MGRNAKTDAAQAIFESRYSRGISFARSHGLAIDIARMNALGILDPTPGDPDRFIETTHGYFFQAMQRWDEIIPTSVKSIVRVADYTAPIGRGQDVIERAEPYYIASGRMVGFQPYPYITDASWNKLIDIGKGSDAKASDARYALAALYSENYGTGTQRNSIPMNDFYTQEAQKLIKEISVARAQSVQTGAAAIFGGIGNVSTYFAGKADRLKAEVEKGAPILKAAAIIGTVAVVGAQASLAVGAGVVTGVGAAAIIGSGTAAAAVGGLAAKPLAGVVSGQGLQAPTISDVVSAAGSAGINASSAASAIGIKAPDFPGIPKELQALTDGIKIPVKTSSGSSGGSAASSASGSSGLAGIPGIDFSHLQGDRSALLAAAVLITVLLI